MLVHKLPKRAVRVFHEATEKQRKRHEKEAEIVGKLFVNGTETEIKRKNVDGTNWVPLRQLSEALGFTVEYDSATDNIYIEK